MRPRVSTRVMDEAIRKAEVLLEAQNYLRTFRDKLTVIKLGGSAMEDPDALRATLQDVVFMETAGMRPVLVHGGGKPIDRAMAEAGLKPVKVQGRRYTDAATLEIVVRVLLHEINTDIVDQIRRLGGRAVGLHTDSLQALFGDYLRLPGSDGRPMDLGYVGRVTRVDGPLIETFCAGGVVPVIPSVALHETDGWLNVNTDTAAILHNRRDTSTLLPSLDAAGCRDLIGQGVIEEGMIPKVEACLESLRAGVRKTHMIDGRLRHSLLLEIYTDRGVGTEIILGQQ